MKMETKISHIKEMNAGRDQIFNLLQLSPTDRNISHFPHFEKKKGNDNLTHEAKITQNLH